MIKTLLPILKMGNNYKTKFIRFLLIFLIGVQGNIFASAVVHDDPKISVKKSTVECESIKAGNVFLSNFIFLSTPGLSQSQSVKAVLTAEYSTLNTRLLDLTIPNQKLLKRDLFFNNDPIFYDVLNGQNGVKAWESALTNDVDDIIRRNPEFLKMLSKYPYGTGKQTLIDNATADEWTQIFSGSLKKANNPDPNAAALVAEYGGESGVIFKTDPSGKEFDLISPSLIGEHKVINTNTEINSGDRHSYRMQFIACQKQSKSGLWVFEGVQNDSHINKVIEYANEYQINTVIKLNGTVIHNLTF